MIFKRAFWSSLSPQKVLIGVFVVALLAEVGRVHFLLGDVMRNNAAFRDELAASVRKQFQGYNFANEQFLQKLLYSRSKDTQERVKEDKKLEELKARFAFFETKIDDAKKEVLLAVAESTARLDELRAVVLASKTGLRAAHERITSESARTLAVAEDVSALRASVASLNVTLLAVEKTLDADQKAIGSFHDFAKKSELRKESTPAKMFRELELRMAKLETSFQLMNKHEF